MNILLWWASVTWLAQAQPPQAPPFQQVPPPQAPVMADDDVFDAQARALVEKLVGPMIEDAKTVISQRILMNRRLQDQTIAEIDFKTASLQQVVDFFRQRSKDLDPQSSPLNILVMPGATKHAEGRTMDLQLKNVPLGVAMRYALQMLGLDYRVEEYAIVIFNPRERP